MLDLFPIIAMLFSVFVFFLIVDSEQKKIKMVIANDYVMLKWRKLTYKKVPLAQVKAVSIRSATSYNAPGERRKYRGHLVGCLALHDCDQPNLSLSMSKNATYVVGIGYSSVLLSTVLRPGELGQLMAATNIPVYVTAEFVNDYGSSIEELLPLNDARVQVCNNA